jgi:hypothetical protein
MFANMRIPEPLDWLGLGQDAGNDGYGGENGGRHDCAQGGFVSTLLGDSEERCADACADEDGSYGVGELGAYEVLKMVVRLLSNSPV